jgi:hypothetical protein
MRARNSSKNERSCFYQNKGMKHMPRKRNSTAAPAARPVRAVALLLRPGGDDNG